MVEIRYPAGWSFGIRNDVIDPEKQKYKLDRMLYFNEESYSTAKWINRFIDGMRKWFTVQNILDWKFDEIKDMNPKNVIVDTIKHPDWVIEVIQNRYETLQEISELYWKSLSTIEKRKQKWDIIKDWTHWTIKKWIII